MLKEFQESAGGRSKSKFILWITKGKKFNQWQYRTKLALVLIVKLGTSNNFFKYGRYATCFRSYIIKLSKISLPNQIFPMKTSIFLLIVVFSTVLNSAFCQRDDPKPYGLKSGIIDYRFSGTQEGVGTLYFDDHGLKANMYLDIVEGDKHKKGYTLTLNKDQYIYDPDQSGEGFKMKNPFFSNLDEERDTETFLKKFYGNMGLEKTGKIIFLDRECDLWKGNEGEAFIWKGILLKLDSYIYGNVIHQEATSIQINIQIDPSLFNIPEGIEFMEMPGFVF